MTSTRSPRAVRCSRRSLASRSSASASCGLAGRASSSSASVLTPVHASHTSPSAPRISIGFCPQHLICIHLHIGNSIPLLTQHAVHSISPRWLRGTFAPMLRMRKQAIPSACPSGRFIRVTEPLGTKS